jgi:hypothetical protein
MALRRQARRDHQSSFSSSARNFYHYFRHKRAECSFRSSLNQAVFRSNYPAAVHDGAICAICMCDVYQCRSNVSVSADTREMKCPGQHTFHTQCASGWFVNEKHNICPFRRRDFSSCCIMTSLIHHVEYNSAHTGFTVQWKNPRHQRLAALNSLFQLPEELSLATSIASALLLSCYESADIAKAALCSGRLSSGI